MRNTEERVIDRIRHRAERGVEKYGKTMERTDLSRAQWLRHAQEEALDLAVYLERLISIEEGRSAPDPNPRLIHPKQVREEFWHPKQVREEFWKTVEQYLSKRDDKGRPLYYEYQLKRWRVRFHPSIRQAVEDAFIRGRIRGHAYEYQFTILPDPCLIHGAFAFEPIQ